MRNARPRYSEEDAMSPEKEQIRVISARNATRREQRDYEEDATD